MSKKLVLFPFGGNTREALMSIFALNADTPLWDILGFIDDDATTHGSQCCGIKVLGGKTILREVTDAKVLALPGNPSTFSRRKEIIETLELEPDRFATIIHPSVKLGGDARIGYNTLLMPNVVVSCGVNIGNHCLVLPNSVVSHDSSVGDYCSIGSNVSISGSVHVGESCYIGTGTKMREHITIGARTLVGLGSNVVSDIPSGVVAAGNPARILKSRAS